MFKKIFFATALCLSVLVTTAFSGSLHYVAPDGVGVASWGASVSEATPCSLKVACASANPGDEIILKGGIYNTPLIPLKDGTYSDRIKYKAAVGEVPLFTNTSKDYWYYSYGVYLRGRKYITVDGIRVVPPIQRPLMITHGSSFNEIKNCRFFGPGAIQFWDGDIVGGVPVTNNWIHDNVFAKLGQVSPECDDWGGVQLGVPSYDNHSNYNTIENNTFYSGGHHNLETFTKYNVVRNNYFHHEGSMSPPPNKTCNYGPDFNNLYGNRNISIYDGLNQDGMFNLFEGNRFGHAGPPPDDDGGDGFTIAAPKNIVRYNLIYNSQNNGVLFKTGYNSFADNNRFYNNTIFKSGRFRNSGPQWQGKNFRWYGNYARVGNVIKNNIFYSYGLAGGDWMGGDVNIYTNNSVVNNLCTDLYQGRCSIAKDPEFVDPDVSNFSKKTLPNLNLKSTSPAIDAGLPLTTATSDGELSKKLEVADALYFSDGSFGSILSNIKADFIAVGTITNFRKISYVDYDNNVLYLSQPTSWKAGDSVWLYSNSKGVKVLEKNAPDLGACEYK